MAISLYTDGTVPELLQQHQWAGLAEKLDVFNANTSGGIVLSSNPAEQSVLGGHYRQTTRPKTIASLDARVDVTATVDLTPLKLETTEGSSVIQTRTLGPVDVADDFHKRTKMTRAEVVTNIGDQFGQAQLQALRNNAIAALVAAAQNVDSGSHVLDEARAKTSGAKVTMTATYAENMFQLMRDARDQMVCWVMPSFVFTSLRTNNLATYTANAISEKLLEQKAVYEFMGLPILVVDAPALTSELTSSYYTEYGVLLLGRDALTARIIDEMATEVDRNIKAPSPASTFRGQYYVDWAIRGAQWDRSGGGINPTDATLATSSNWDDDCEDHREFPVVYGIFNG